MTSLMVEYATHTHESRATLNTKLYDAYVRFFRWASDRLGARPGIVCFITNNGFFRGIAFDAFRREVARDFSSLWHFDLKGNARTSGERRKREGGNIFDDKIRTGVGISVLVKRAKRTKFTVRYHSVADYARSAEKKQYVRRCGSIENIEWAKLFVDVNHNWLEAKCNTGFDRHVSVGNKKSKRLAHAETIFLDYAPGANTARDPVVYCSNPEEHGDKLRDTVPPIL